MVGDWEWSCMLNNVAHAYLNIYPTQCTIGEIYISMISVYYV
jgi:hypothetical protein